MPAYYESSQPMSDVPQLVLLIFQILGALSIVLIVSAAGYFTGQVAIWLIGKAFKVCGPAMVAVLITPPAAAMAAVSWLRSRIHRES